MISVVRFDFCADNMELSTEEIHEVLEDVDVEVLDLTMTDERERWRSFFVDMTSHNDRFFCYRWFVVYGLYRIEPYYVRCAFCGFMADSFMYEDDEWESMEVLASHAEFSPACDCVKRTHHV